MRLLYLELNGFKSFGKKTKLIFESSITAVVGPNGSGKSNVAEAFRWVLGEQSLKSLRGKRGEDLIFNGGQSASRQNRASVSIAFDNRHREFNLDFDEVVISRTVHRDGVNEYQINGSQVRLKDIIELLAGISLGSTGHHIISQGEADRLLNANLRERRELIEEALGLKIYHWKISESEKKLAKTEENIKQVESLRREIAPHLKFLKKQVEKAEAADRMRRELKQYYLAFFNLEEEYLKKTKVALLAERVKPEEDLNQVLGEIDSLSKILQKSEGETDNSFLRLQADLNKRLRELQNHRDELSRRLGRLEGILEVKQESLVNQDLSEIKIDLHEVESLVAVVNDKVQLANQITDVSSVQQIVKDIRDLISNLIVKYRQGVNNRVDRENALANLQTEKSTTVADLQKIEAEEIQIKNRLTEIQFQLETEKQKTIGAERQLYELRVRKSELSAQLDALRIKLEKLKLEEDEFKRELTEAVALVDQEILRYAEIYKDESNVDKSRGAQEERRRQIERLKIRLEDMGLDSSDALLEYQETTKRDEFLAQELADLAKGAEGLRQVMVELRDRLTVEFNTGIAQINQEFVRYFSLMFGGGGAALEIIQAKKRRRGVLEFNLDDDSDIPEEEAEEGIEISVNLPRKKIKGLQMLSGGERALTSIALLFAMSQVNPPPFLILDETDAALDEANSRKYGDMIENLAQRSQLILITHNRETMSRAGVLYGVTMGSDGVSKLLSIKFDQAENYAK